jgi:TonB family protein
VVRDPSGAVVPNVVILVSTKGRKEITRSSAAGEYSISSLPDGEYKLEGRVPGFAMFVTTFKLEANSNVQVDVPLEMGRVAESMDIVGKGPGPLAAPEAPRRIRVGGNVQATKIRKMVRPKYPEYLQAQGVEGTVMMEAVISKSGSLLSLRPVNTLVHADLVKAAMEAVEQWQYVPTLLNGEPVEIITTITFNYRLQ